MRLRLRAVAFLGLVFAGITCSESATGPSSSSLAPARVFMVPEFSAEAARAYGVLAAAGTDITNIHIVLTGPDGATRDTVVSFPVGVDVATIDITVPAGSDGQPFAALIELRAADGTVLFSGSRVLIARSSSFPRTSPPVITINYTGPGRTTRTVTVSPRDTIVAGTPAISYSATAIDSAGAPVANLLVGWTSSDPTVATATSTGSATASVVALGKRGNTTISARTPLGITGSSVLTVVPPASKLVVISGGAQTAPGGTTLLLPFVVEAQGADNLPVPGTSITFSAITAGGSVARAIPVVTNAAGRAAMALTLGTLAGLYQFEAAALGLAPVTVTETALAGSASGIAIFSGNIQSELVGRVLAAPLVVKVTDTFGGGVSGATVTWSRAAGAGTVGAATTTTAADGTARISYTLGATAGAEVISATLQGGATVQFGATAIAIGVPTITLVSGGGQTGAPNALLAAPLVVRVDDAGGQPLAGQLVTFTSSANRASFNPASVTTGANGLASTVVTLGATLGPATLTATSGTLTLATGATITVGTPASIAKVAGDLQTATAGAAVGTMPSVVVKDAGGNPVPNAPVVFAVASGGGSASGLTTTTNAFGVATVGSWTLGALAGPNTLTATSGALSTTFSATAVAGTGSVLALTTPPSATAASGATLGTQPVVQLRDAAGNDVATAGVVITASVTSGTGTLANATAATTTGGAATFTGLAISGMAGAFTLQFTATGYSPVSSGTITLGAGAPFAIGLIAGNGQTATVSTAVPTAPAVAVKDAVGNPVAGVVVTFGVVTAGAQISEGVTTGTTLTVSTNANGIAALASWTLGGTAQTYVLNATATGLTGSPVTFNATAVAGTGSQIVFATTPSITAASGAALSQQPVIQLKDASGNLVNTAGVVITAGVLSGPGGLNNVTATTVAGGTATFSGLTINGLAGAYVLRFSSPGFTTLQSAPIAVVAGAPNSMSISVGDNQTGVVGGNVPVPPAVLVSDNAGNPVAGVVVTFNAATPGSQVANSATSGATVAVTTNALGIATLTSWTLGSTPQQNILTASAAVPNGSPLTFTATASAGTGSQLTFAAQPPATATVGVALVPQPMIQLKDGFGNNAPTSGVVVNAIVSTGGALVNASATTNAAGLATFTGLGFTGTAGNFTLQFAATGFANLPFGSVAVSAGAASGIGAAAGNNQTAAVGTAVPVAPAVKVVDASGNPVSGVVVTFSAATPGSTVSNGTTTSTSVTVATNASGIAMLASWTLGNTVQGYLMTAAASGLAGSPVTFSATAVAGTGSQLALVQQPSATATSGTALVVQPVLQLKDALGNNVTTSGVVITATVSSGAGLVSHPTATTNGLGTAVFTGLSVTGNAGTITLLFAVPGYTSVISSPIVLTAGTGAALAFIPSWNPGPTAALSFFSPGPTVQVMDASGNAVAVGGVPVTVTVASGPSAPVPFLVNNTTSTNVNGVASFTGLAVGGAAGTYTLTFTGTGLTPVTSSSVVITPGAGASIGVVSGNNQTAPVLTAVPVAPQVLLKDAFGSPVPNQTVTFTVLNAGSVLSNATTSGTSVTVRTNASGLASLTSWTLGSAARIYSISASFPGAQTIFFSATAVAGPPVTIAIYAGNNQSGPAGFSLLIPPSVVVTDASGNGVGGLSVQFTVVTGGATVSNGAVTGPTAAVITGPTSGIAQLNAWTLGPVAQTYTMRATLAGVAGSPITFTANGTSSAASSMQINGGNNQTATVGSSVATPPSVLVRDPNGNPVAGTVVTFTIVTAGSQVANGAASGTMVTATSNASGIAALTRWTLGNSAQAYTLSADAPGLSGSPATFTATAVASNGTTLSLGSTPPSQTPSGATITPAVQVQLRAATGAPVSGAQVTASVEPGSSGNVALAGTTVTLTTNASGDATFSTLVVTGSPGSYKLKFTTPGAQELVVTLTIP